MGGQGISPSGQGHNGMRAKLFHAALYAAGGIVFFVWTANPWICAWTLLAIGDFLWTAHTAKPRLAAT